MADAKSRGSTPGREIWRTIISRRGRRTVAARWAMWFSSRKRAYSLPHSAAGRWAKSRIVSRPATVMPLGRTRTAVTSRSLAPISMPMPEPAAMNFFQLERLGDPGIVVPAQSLQLDVLFGAEDDGGCHAAAQIG